jgi:hypothetical protein
MAKRKKRMTRLDALRLYRAYGGLTVVIEDMKDWYGVSLERDQAKQILKYCMKNASYFECGWDTVCREAAINYIGKIIVGKDWPLGEDTEEYSREFFVELISKAGDLGYKIDASRYKKYLLKKRMQLRFGETK